MNLQRVKVFKPVQKCSIRKGGRKKAEGGRGNSVKVKTKARTRIIYLSIYSPAGAILKVAAFGCIWLHWTRFLASNAGEIRSGGGEK